MKITFVVAYLEETGGHRAVLEIATRLQRSGHEVTLLYPSRSILSRRNAVLRSAGVEFDPLFRTNGGVLDWYDFPGEIVRAKDLDPASAPAADVVVATAWQTAEWVARFPHSAGRKAYFIQHYETWSGPTRRVDATWRLPFIRIASSKWLADLARERFGLADVAVVPYGVDQDVFWPDRPPPTASGALRVGLMYHLEPWKGVADALHAARAVGQPVDLVAFGVFERGSDLWDAVEYHRRPTRDELRRIYSSLDVFLCASWSETGPMTIPEAMACGTAVVSTRVGNVPLWTADGEAAFLAPPRDVAELTRQLQRALTDAAERARRAALGHELIGSYTWDRAAQSFAQAIGAAT